MPKKKPKKLQYSTDLLYRWNLCQKIAKCLYKGNGNIEYLEMLLEEVESKIFENFNK